MSEHGAVHVRDIREAPFCWQEKTALRLIRNSFKPSEAPVAGYVYVALTELASDHQRQDFQIKRMTLAKRVGRSGNVLDSYLNRLADLKLIEKSPMAVDGEYRCMTIRLLPAQAVVEQEDEAPLPAVGVSLPTGTPPSSLPTRTPVPTHRDTPPCPQGNSSEESSLKNNLPPQYASPSASRVEEPSDHDSPSREEGLAARAAGDGKPVGSQAESASDLHPRKGSGVPGMNTQPKGDPEGEKLRKAKKEKYIPGYDPRKPISEWKELDAIGYFRFLFKQKWPGEGAPDYSVVKDIPALRHRFQWLMRERLPLETMKNAIDYLFEKWDNGLPSRLRLDGSRPGLGIIESTRLFEMIVMEMRNGVGTVKTVDQYSEKSHADFKKRVEETGDPWGGLGRVKS